MPPPPRHCLLRAARALRRASRLHLFNFDVIVPCSGACSSAADEAETETAGGAGVETAAYVIDMNHFPSYSDFHGWERHLALLLFDAYARISAGGGDGAIRDY